MTIVAAKAMEKLREIGSNPKPKDGYSDRNDCEEREWIGLENGRVSKKEAIQVPMVKQKLIILIYS